MNQKDRKTGSSKPVSKKPAAQKAGRPAASVRGGQVSKSNQQQNLPARKPPHTPAPANPSQRVSSPPPKAQEPFKDQEYRDTFGEGEELAKAFEKPVPPPKNPAPPASPKKRHPKRKKGYGLLGIPHILVTLVWLAILLAVGVSLGRLVWLCAADVLAFGKPDQEVVVTIEKTDTIEDVTKKLKDAGLIKYSKLFMLYAKVTDAMDDISAGEYTLNSIYDYHALVNSMSPYSAAKTIVEVSIPEGYTCAQIFQLLEEKKVCSVEDLEEYAANGELDEYWFLEGVERGTPYCLEGFLFPDTYEFYTSDSPERVLEKLLDDFEYRFTDAMREDLVTLNQEFSEKMAANGYEQDYIDDHQISLRQLVTVASLIEKESAGTDERYTISSVIYNRLANLREYPYLNIDATISYALGEFRALTLEDLQIDSPYNTYTHRGLTPGPISNPGLTSLQAALNPDETEYYYYALDPETNEHHFSKTLEEHEDFLASLDNGEGDE